MHIVLANITNGGLSGGSLKYLQKLLPRIAADKRVDHLDVLVPPCAVPALSPLEPVMSIHSFRPVGPTRVGSWWKVRIAELRPDVVFIPTARWVDCRCTSSVVMVRNMEPFVTPFVGNPLSERLKNLVRRRVARQACMQATRVIGVSDYVSDFLVNRLHVPCQKVRTIYHGVGAPLPRETAVRPASLNEEAPRDFFFTAGSIRPARGIEDAIAALATLQSRGRRAHLVVAGTSLRNTRKYHRRIMRLSRRLGVAEQIHWVGQLNAEEMAWCFYHSDAFVMTSRAEACPNIVLEAMQHGCRSISTDQMPMPEFFRESARYYQAGSGDSLAEQLAALRCAEQRERQRLRSLALARASDFDWQRTAEQTVSYLTEASGSGRQFSKAA